MNIQFELDDGNDAKMYMCSANTYAFTLYLNPTELFYYIIIAINYFFFVTRFILRNMAERIVPPVAEVSIELCRVKGEGGSLRGYIREMITENLSERERTIYRCPRCEGIMKDCSTTEKGEQLCACCLGVGEESHSNEPIRIKILSLKCSCPLSKRGCDWLDKLGNVEDHLAVCQYVYESCVLMCGVVLTRDEMIRHVREECTQREEACLHCSRIYEVCEMAEHVEVCGKVEVMCELGCGTRMRHGDTLCHRHNECSEDTVMCPYVKYGCKAMELKQRELRQHLEENRLLHTEMKSNAPLAENNQSLRNQIESLNVKLEMKDKEIKFLIEEVQYEREETVRWRIQRILEYFKPNQGNYVLLQKFSRQLESVLFPFTFRLSHTTNATHFNIYFNHSKIPWYLNIPRGPNFYHIKLVFFVRVICHIGIEHSLLYKSPIVEIRDPYSAETNKICSIPLSTDLKGFLKSGCLGLVVRICKFKDQDFSLY